MHTTEGVLVASSPPLSRWHRLAPVFTLLILTPVIAEVLSGATRLSFIFVLIPEIMVWGCGALIAREVVRGWHGGSISMLLLGLSVVEEFIIQQTSLAPLPWVSSPAYGRAWGVNWIFFLFVWVYESVMVVLVPVQLSELIFPNRRNQPWLKKAGMMISSLIFVLGSFIAWFLWTQLARPRTFPVPKYQPPFLAFFFGLLSILLLTLAAYALRNVGRHASRAQATSSTPSRGLWPLLPSFLASPGIS